MSLRKLPEAKTFSRPNNFQWDCHSDVLAKWAEISPMAASDDDATISIFDVIGEDFWTGGGFTAKRMDAALRSIGNTDVTVMINSPGGDLFEGIAIYNLLRDHPAKVTIHVLGWAASAASVIAMAGDDIAMGLGSFMMVHNAWGMVVGNRHDMRDGADLFDGFDSAITDIYEARTGIKRSQIESLMDKETFMSPSMAVENKFADRIDEGIDDGASNAAKANNFNPGLKARRSIEASLAGAGFTRKDRSEMISALMNEDALRDASPQTAPRDASELDVAQLEQLIS